MFLSDCFVDEDVVITENHLMWVWRINVPFFIILCLCLHSLTICNFHLTHKRNQKIEKKIFCVFFKDDAPLNHHSHHYHSYVYNTPRQFEHYDVMGLWAQRINKTKHTYFIHSCSHTGTFATKISLHFLFVTIYCYTTDSTVKYDHCCSHINPRTAYHHCYRDLYKPIM